MKQQLQSCMQAAVDDMLREHGQGDPVRVHLVRPRNQAHGDFASNVALETAGRLKCAPRQAAEKLLAQVNWPDAVEAAEIAGPGFINIRLKHGSEADVLLRIIEQGEQYGRAAAGDEKVCVEYVSANPTGPMHVGHGRGAVVGDAVANVLAACGYRVHREYYINDAGAQVGVLAESVWWRMRELQGETVVQPDDAYPGEYVVDAARRILERNPFEQLASLPDAKRRKLLAGAAVQAMMDMIQGDLAVLGIGFDQFFSESDLHASGSVDGLIEKLQELGAVYRGVLPPPKGRTVEDYQPVEQLLFRTTDYGDDVDRPLAKQDGTPTYFAADIAYHFDKHERGFDRLVDVWGADHGGYVARVQSAMQALSGKPHQPEVVLVQMVNLTREGKPVRMSKRAGTFVTLREVIDEVGRDAVRFNFLTRKAESQLEFDLETAKEQSDENPVYYAQYAHARACSVIRRAGEEGLKIGDAGTVDLTLLRAKEEAGLLAMLLHYPDVLAQASKRLEPYRVATFLLQLAADFHSFYHKHRVIGVEPELGRARLLLVAAIAQVMRNGLGLLGVSAPESM